MTDRNSIIPWLNSIEIVAEPTGDQIDEVWKLLDEPGLAVLLGLLLGQRQGSLVTLSLVPAASVENQHTISRIQGEIKGLDALRNTLLELFPSDPSHDGDKQ